VVTTGLVDVVSANERPIASHIETLLDMLDQFIGHFESAVTLFHQVRYIKANIPREPVQEWFDASQRCSGWTFVAARDGAISIYNFAECVEALKEQIHHSSEIKSLVSKAALRDATKEFQRAFRSYEGLRHTVAHAAELRGSPRQLEKNSTDKDFVDRGMEIKNTGSLFLGGNLHNNTFHAMHRGQPRSYDVTPESVAAMRTVRDKILTAIKERSGNANEVE
jgi:hypothetical protein